MALVGLMQTLALEGEKYGIRVNCLAPSAATRMVEGLMSEDDSSALDPALVSPAVVALAADNAPNKTIICAGGGSFEIAHVALTRGLHFTDPDTMAEAILSRFEQLGDTDGIMIPKSGFDLPAHQLGKARG